MQPLAVGELSSALAGGAGGGMGQGASLGAMGAAGVSGAQATAQILERRARQSARRGYQRARAALSESGLGWGYGALHAVLEGAVGLRDWDTASDILGE